MRVALTHVYCWPELRRGGERYLHELASALAARGHDTTILSTAPRRSRSIEDGVTVVRLGRRRRRRPAEVERSFGRHVVPRLLAGRFDAVHSLGASDGAASVWAARLRRHRTVYTNLGLPIRSSWARRPDGKAHARVVADVDVYGCLSAHAAHILAADWGRQGARTPGGVDLDRFRPAPSRAQPPTLLYSGSLTEPRKRVADLLAAVALLARQVPDVRLWLSGPGDPTPLLTAAPAAARDRTEVLPLAQPETQAERYGEAWATVLPSMNEAFGLVLVESMACGTPVVGARHAAIPELVTPEVGYLAEPRDPAALAAACAAALDLSQRPGTADACRAAAEPYGWDRLAATVERLYEGS